MVQSGGGPRFALESVRELFLGNFEGNGAVQAGVVGFEYLPHASRSDHGEDFAWTELHADRAGMRRIRTLSRAGDISAM